LEPYGGQALGFSVAETTRLTALFAAGTLAGFAVASRVLSGSVDAVLLGRLGAIFGVPGFLAIILASVGGGAVAFLAGVFVTGVGAGLFGHATLTATIRAAPPGRIGLALGAWGAVQATSAGIGVALAGLTRDIIFGLPSLALWPAEAPYNVVFGLEIAVLVLAIVIAAPGITGRYQANDENKSVEVS
ncbi:MAG: PucC family protein, partial [Pseudomonadota bacterium]